MMANEVKATLAADFKAGFTMKCLLLFAILLTLDACQSPSRFQGELDLGGAFGNQLSRAD